MKYQKYVFCLKRINIKLFLGLLQYLGVFRETVQIADVRLMSELHVLLNNLGAIL